MSASEIERTLVRLVHEIIEKNNGAADLGLVGIRRRGVFIAQRLGQMIGRIEKTPVPVGTLDITLYRDDLSTVGPKPVVQKTEIDFPITGKNIVLVDDVLYTGRTVRAAMDALFKQGRPKQVQLLRADRPRPSRAAHRGRFVGRKVQTTIGDHRGPVARNRRRGKGSAGGKARLTGSAGDGVSRSAMAPTPGTT